MPKISVSVDKILDQGILKIEIHLKNVLTVKGKPKNFVIKIWNKIDENYYKIS